MDSFFARYKNPLVLLGIVLLQTIALAVQVPHQANPVNVHDSRQTTTLRYWAALIVAPLERLSHSVSPGVRNGWTHDVYLRHTREQNDALRAEVSRLRVEQAAFAEDAAQGRRLGSLLQFREHYIGSTVAAQVIGTSGSDRSRVLLIDKGSVDGLREDQPVMTPDGIVGKLRDVFPHTAQLLLISDPMSGAGVMLQPSRLRGILRGTTTGHVEVGNLTADPSIHVGDAVVTSGGDQIYPRGLPVGTVTSIAPDTEHQPYVALQLKPAADLQRLEEVLVITGTQDHMTAQQQSDVATADDAAAAAESTKRASELVAARLPSMKDPNAAAVAGVDTAGADGKDSNTPHSGTPRPQHPLHADHYSPGAAPPADTLQPGARQAGDPALPRSQPREPAATPEPPATSTPASPGPQAGAAFGTNWLEAPANG